MTPKEAVQRNLEVDAGFWEYVMEHPGLLDLMPDEARLVFLPLDDLQLCEYNLWLAEQAPAKDDVPDRPVVYILRIPTDQKDKPLFILVDVPPDAREQFAAIVRSFVTMPKRITAVGI